MAERHDDEADHVFDGELLPETPALERVSEKRRRTGAVSALLVRAVAPLQFVAVGIQNFELFAHAPPLCLLARWRTGHA